MLNTQLRADRHRIEELLAQHPEAGIFRSFPAMGPVTAATMLAEMGEDRGRFPTADVLLADTGPAPVTRSSGRTRPVRFRYAANQPMRHAIDWWALPVRESDWARTAYDQARPAATPTARSAASAPAGPASSALLDRPHHLRPQPAPARPAQLT